MRLHLKSPGFLAVAVLALALGIGANTAVFSIVYSVLLKPLPYPAPDRLMAIFDTQPDCATCPASFPKYIDWRDQNTVFEVIGGSTPAGAILTGLGEPEQIRIASTTASLFRVFAVPPMSGRWFTEEEDKPGGPAVVILSHGFWQRRLGANPRVLGSVVTIDGVARTVAGVMPRGFAHRGAEAWIPLARVLDEGRRNNHFLATYGRLWPGVGFAQARKDMIALGGRLAGEHDNMGHGIDIKPYAEIVSGRTATPLLVLLASVAFVLLIACANVANLLLARASTRRREIALRTAIGASRGRLARQFLTESLLLSIAGGTLGLGLAYAGVRLFVASAPNVLPRTSEIGVDGNVLLFTLAVAMATGMVFGMAPVLHARDTTANDALKEETGRHAGGAMSRFAGNALVVTEVALSVVLLVGAGLMVKSLMHLRAQDLGMDVERVVTASIALPNAKYGTDDARRAFFAHTLDRLRSIPGVQAVGATSLLPLAAFGNNNYFDVEGKTLWPHDKGPLVETRVVAGDYHLTMGIPLVRGRFPTERDSQQSTPVIVINQAMARRCWPNEDPIGKRIVFQSNSKLEVVGLVGDVRSDRPDAPPAIEVSVPFEQTPQRTMTLVMRSVSRDPAALVGAIRHELAAVDPAQPLANVRTMSRVVEESVASPRLLSSLISGFAVLAGLLAAIGVYGLVSYSVSQRTREFGVRMAIGADARAVFALVFRRGITLTAAGIAVGSLAALALTRLLTTLLYEVAPTDLAVFAVVCLGVLAAALIACYVPAKAATRVDPVMTLRTT